MSSLHAEITNQLASLSDTPNLDASVLLAHILDKPRSWVMAHPELTLTSTQQKQLDGALTRLEHREPLPYVLGHWEFFGLDFEVTPDVLIPRPETELLVEKAIVWLQQNPARKNVADVGTGSGAIAVTLAVNVPQINILATDISPRALEVARRNAEMQGVSQRIKFIECDLLPNQSSIVNHQSKIDLLCANLPYIPTNTLHTLPIYGREPTLALDGGTDGLDLVRKLLQLAPEWLAPHALILLEIEATRGAQALSLAHDFSPEAKVALHQDLAGQDRLVEIQL
jgi:release factor glutamine methyltransferase